MPKRVTPDYSYLQRNANGEPEIVCDGQPLCNPFVTEYGHTVYAIFILDYGSCLEQHIFGCIFVYTIVYTFSYILV